MNLDPNKKSTLDLKIQSQNRMPLNIQTRTNNPKILNLGQNNNFRGHWKVITPENSSEMHNSVSTSMFKEVQQMPVWGTNFIKKSIKNVNSFVQSKGNEEISKNVPRKPEDAQKEIQYSRPINSHVLGFKAAQESRKGKTNKRKRLERRQEEDQ